MVKSYDRYEQEAVFGVIASQSNIVWLPPAPSQSSKSIGRAATGAVEQILIWDIKTGELLQTLSDGLTPGASNAKTSSAPPQVAVLAHHVPTNLLASGHSDGSVKVWDLTSGTVVLTFSGHKSAVSVLQFDFTGTRLVSGAADSSIVVWDLVAEEGLFKLKGHKAQITGIALMHDAARQNSAAVAELGEDYLISTSKDGLVKLWDLKARQCIETHLAHSGECWALGTNSKKDTLITTGSKNQAKVWTVDLARDDGSKIAARGDFDKQSSSRCTHISFTTVKDSEVFFLQNSDRTCELFRVRSADEIKKGVAKRTKRLREKGLDEDEIASSLREADISMMLTPLSTVRTVAKLRSCVWVPSGRKLELLVSLANNSIEYHSVPVPEQLKKASVGEVHSVKTHSVDLAGHRTDIRAMDISDDDRLLATASNGELKVWNLRTRSVLRTFALQGGYALCCRFLPGGTLVVVGFKNGDLELYDLASSSMVDRVENAHENTTAATTGSSEDSGAAIWSLDITPDGKRLVTGGNDKNVKFWEFQVVQEAVPGTQAVVATLKLAHVQTLQLSDEVLCVKISPDSRFLAISLLNNNVQVVFFDTLKLFLTLYGHKLPVLSIDISHDGKLLVTSSADKNIKLWGLDFGDCHKSIFGHSDSVMAVRFIPDSHHFFSAGKDGMVKYWDGDKFQCIQKLPAHHGEVWALCVSRNGASVVSTAHDHSVRLWSATNDQVFLEEEREKEMDELYESELLESLEADGAPRGEDDDENSPEDGEAKVSKQTMETLKAGEKLMEALDIGTEDLAASDAYAAQLHAYQTKLPGASMPVKPTPNAILQAYGITGQQHVLDVLLKIRAAQLEDALLVLPFSYTVKLMRFIEIWTNSQNVHGNLVHLATICKVLFFVIRVNAKELISQKDEGLRTHLIKVKAQLRDELEKAAKQLGYNTSGLKFQKHQWKLHHETEFIDEAEQREHVQKHAVKRTFATV